MLAPWKKSYDQHRQHIKKVETLCCQHRSNLVKAMVFSLVMYGCESWTIKKLRAEEMMPLNCVVENTLESPLDYKGIQLVHPKGNQSWMFIGKIDDEAETLILWPLDVKNWLIWKDLSAGKDWRWEEKGATEHEMVGWPHQLNGHESEEILVVCDGQRGLACCIPWGHTESDTTE